MALTREQVVGYRNAGQRTWQEIAQLQTHYKWLATQGEQDRVSESPTQSHEMSDMQVLILEMRRHNRAMERLAQRHLDVVSGNGFTHVEEERIDFRDRAALIALPSIIDLCRHDTRPPGQSMSDMFARKAYQIADAMWEARKENK